MADRRLSELDPIKEYFGGAGRLPFQVGFGASCFGAALLMRGVVDMFAAGAGPFSLIFPAIMISTLYGRWQAGLVTFVLAYLHAWYVVLPFSYSFLFENPGDRARTIVNGSAALVILGFAEAFRAAVQRAARERDQELQTQQLLMTELEHRTKNNFAMVSSLLSMQQRKSKSEEVRHALMSAAARVRSFAAIHETIYTSKTFSAQIHLPDYLGPMMRQLERGLLETDRIQIELACDPIDVPRDRALALGLVINELVTNAAKHAFPGGRAGTITVSYREPRDGPWRLVVSDDGCGLGPCDDGPEIEKSGLGQHLLQSFAASAGGEIVREDSPLGTRICVVQSQE